MHPVTAVVGGFTSEPDAGELEASMRERLLDGRRGRARHRRSVPQLRRTRTSRRPARCSRWSPSDDYAIYDGAIGALDAGWRRPWPSTATSSREEVVGHSNAKHSTVDGRTFMVGALPRVNLSAPLLEPLAREALRVGRSRAAVAQPLP